MVCFVKVIMLNIIFVRNIVKWPPHRQCFIWRASHTSAAMSGNKRLNLLQARPYDGGCTKPRSFYLRNEMLEVAAWLESRGMSEYAERFAENRIDATVLRDLTD